MTCAAPGPESTVILTGASSGIGKSTAALLARTKCRLCLVGRNESALAEVASTVSALGGSAIVRIADVANETSMNHVIESTERELGPIDFAISCAGQYIRSTPESLTSRLVRDSMEVNFQGALNLFLPVLPGMLRRRRGHLLAVTSVDGRKGLPLDAPYVAAKFALTGFLDSLRQDLRSSGVRVTTVLPGRVDTPMIGDLDVPMMSRKITPDRVARVIVRSLAGRGGEVLVPYWGPKTLLIATALSPRLADMLIRVFRLEGTPRLNVDK
jgi:short-subunit dehydrogenase